MAKLGTFSGGGLGFGVTFSLRDGFSSVSDRIRSKFSQLDAEASNLADRVNDSFGKITAGAGMVAMGLGMLAPVGLGIKMAGEFEAAEFQLTTLLRSADKAREVFNGIKQDAAFTPFGTKELLKANAALISTGLEAGAARNDVMALGNAIAATGGGNEEMQRMVFNMQQIRNLGKASSMDIKQFGMAGIPIYKLLSDSTGKTVAEVQEMNITYEMVTEALKKAAQAGGMYEGAMAKMAQTVNGKLNTLQDNFSFSMASIGQAVLPIFHKMLDFVNKLLEKFQQFAETGIGKLVIRIVVFSIAAVSLGLVLVGLKIILLALIPVILTLKAVLIEFILPVLAVVAGIYLLYKLLNSGRPLLFAFGVALMVAFGPFGIIAGVVIMAMRAVRSFNEYFENMSENMKKSPSTGLVGFFIRFGGILKGIGEIFSTMSSNGWEMSEELEAALQKLGILDTVVAIGTWIVRIREMFKGVRDGLMMAWNFVKRVFRAIETGLSPIFSAFDKLGFSIDKTTSSMEKWRKIGVVVGLAIAAVLGIVLIAVGAIVVGLVIMAVQWVISAAMMIIAFLPVILVVGLIIAVIYGIYSAIVWLADNWQAIVAYIRMEWEKLVNDVSSFFSSLMNWGSAAWDAGVSFVQNLWDGIKSMWSSFTTWLDKEISDIPILGSIYGITKDVVGGIADMITGEDTQQAPAVAPVRAASLTGFGTGVARNRAASNNTVVNNSQQLNPTFHIPIMMDGEVIATHTVDKVEEKQKFNGNR